jgi:drug/metabolite transporter (DMT)-like permease
MIAAMETQAPPKPRRAVRGEWLMLLTALIWGTGFVAQRQGMSFVGPFTFIAARFLLGGLALTPVLYLTKTLPLKPIQHSTKPKWLPAALACGAALFIAASFQQIGLTTTSAGKAGFITALYIVIVPILGLPIGKKVRLIVWLAVVIATFGLYLLTIKSGVTISKGDLTVLVGAFVWAVHILLIDHFSSNVPGLLIACGQFLVTGVLGLIAALLFEDIALSALLLGGGTILYAGIIVVSIAYTLQVLGQKGVNPSIAALILSLESVFAVLAGTVFLNERLTPREWLGCALMLAAVIITQLGSSENRNQLDD